MQPSPDDRSNLTDEVFLLLQLLMKLLQYQYRIYCHSIYFMNLNCILNMLKYNTEDELMLLKRHISILIFWKTVKNFIHSILQV